MKHRVRHLPTVAAAVVAAFAIHAEAQTPTAPPVYLTHPAVVDTAHLKGGGTEVTLAGLQGWAGDPAHELQAVIAQAGDHVSCEPLAGPSYVCKLPNGADLGQLALALGDAKALDDAPANYRTEQAAAAASHRGVWASQVAGPAILQHPAVQTTAVVAANGRRYPLFGLEGFPAPYYTLQLQTFIDSHGSELSCTERDGSGRYVCYTEAGMDIATVALLEGLARASADAPPEYRADQAQAARDKSGFWFSPPQQVVTQFAPAPAPLPAPQCCDVPPGSAEPILSYDDGIPVVIVESFPAPFVYIREIGWGYYDHVGAWHVAPAAYRAQLTRAYPNGPAEAAANRSLAAPSTRLSTGLPGLLRGTGPAGFGNPGGWASLGVRQAPFAGFAGQPGFRARLGTPPALARAPATIGLSRVGIGRFDAVRPPAVGVPRLFAAPRR